MAPTSTVVVSALILDPPQHLKCRLFGFPAKSNSFGHRKMVLGKDQAEAGNH